MTDTIKVNVYRILSQLDGRTKTRIKQSAFQTMMRRCVLIKGLVIDGRGTDWSEEQKRYGKK